MENFPKSIADYKVRAENSCESYYCNFTATACSVGDFCNSSDLEGICETALLTCHHDNATTCITSCDEKDLPFCNSTWNCTVQFECQEHEILSKTMECVVYLIYSMIFLFALFGNGTVCYIVYASQRMRTVTNFFIVNLALGDILMTLFCIPFTFVSVLILHYWPFGAIMCSAVSTIQAITVFVSAYTLVAITVERYVALIYPLRPRMTKLQAKVIIVTVWLVACLTALPIAIVTGVDTPDAYYEWCDEHICMEMWDDPAERYRYSISLMVLQYFFPLTVLIVCYSRIAMVVWGNRMPGEDGHNAGQRMARSKRKVIKMLVTVVLVFTLCWLPFNTLQVLGDLHPSIWDWKHIKYVWACAHWLAMSHTCYNPIIYCWMNKDFRFGFFFMLHRIPCLRRFIPQPIRQSRAFLNYKRSSVSHKFINENSMRSCERSRVSLKNVSIKSNTSYSALSTSSKMSHRSGQKCVTFRTNHEEGDGQLQKLAREERKISVPPALSVFSEEESNVGETKL